MKLPVLPCKLFFLMGRITVDIQTRQRKDLTCRTQRPHEPHCIRNPKCMFTRLAPINILFTVFTHILYPHLLLLHHHLLLLLLALHLLLPLLVLLLLLLLLEVLRRHRVLWHHLRSRRQRRWRGSCRWRRRSCRTCPCRCGCCACVAWLKITNFLVLGIELNFEKLFAEILVNFCRV